MNGLLTLGADANYNTHGYGDATPLMAARDPEIMKILIDHKANPMEVNAHNQTDFAYKLLAGVTAAVVFYAQSAAQIPLQPLLDNFHDCVLTRDIPVVPEGRSYRNVIDQPLIDAMLANQYLPFSSRALAYNIGTGLTVWHYIRIRMQDAPTVSPTLLTAYLACMSKGRALQTEQDFACVEACLDKPLPNELSAPGVISRSLFIYMLFALGALPRGELLRWLFLLGRVIQRVAIWMDLFGEAPFRVTNASRPTEAHRDGAHLLHELSTLQSLLTLRVGVPDDFGEFSAPMS